MSDDDDDGVMPGVYVEVILTAPPSDSITCVGAIVYVEDGQAEPPRQATEEESGCSPNS